MVPSLLEVLLLGLLAAVNPCQIAISLAALAAIMRNGEVRGLWFYSTGRVLAHTLLAWVILLVVGGSEQAVTAFRSWFAAVEWLVPWLMTAGATFFLWRALFPCRHHDACHDSGRIIRQVSPHGAFLLGMALAMAFCPESAVFYFGMMLPLGMAHSQPILFPVVYAVAAALPVLVLGLLQGRVRSIAVRLNQGLFHAQRLVNLLFALLLGTMAAWVWLE